MNTHYRLGDTIMEDCNGRGAFIYHGYIDGSQNVCETCSGRRKLFHYLLYTRDHNQLLNCLIYCDECLNMVFNSCTPFHQNTA